MGQVGAGLLKDISSGEHGLVLLGDGLSWEGTVNAVADQTVTVEATPREVGAISYVVPEGASAEITAFNFRKVASGSGKLERVPAGSYEWKAQGANYKDAAGTLTVKKAGTADLSPSLAFSDAYQARLDKEKRDKEYWKFTKEIERLDRTAAPGGWVGDADIASANALIVEIRGSPHGFKDLADRAAELVATLRARKTAQEAETRKKETAAKLATLQVERDQLRKNLAGAQASRTGLSTVGWVSFGTGLASAAGAIASFVLSYLAHEAYNSSTITADIVAARQNVQLWSTVTIAAGSAAGGAMALGGILWLTAPDPVKLEARIAEVDGKIKELSGGAQ